MGRDEKEEKNHLRNALDSFWLLLSGRKQISLHFILPTCYLFLVVGQDIVDELWIIPKDKSLEAPERWYKKRIHLYGKLSKYVVLCDTLSFI